MKEPLREKRSVVVIQCSIVKKGFLGSLKPLQTIPCARLIIKEVHSLRETTLSIPSLSFKMLTHTIETCTGLRGIAIYYMYILMLQVARAAANEL